MTLIALRGLDRNQIIKKVATSEYRLPQCVTWKDKVFLRCGYTKVLLTDSTTEKLRNFDLPFYQQVHSQPLAQLLFRQDRD